MRFLKIWLLIYCIYEKYYQSFLQWILFKFNGIAIKDKLLEDAKDAFQNGIIVFYQCDCLRTFRFRFTVPKDFINVKDENQFYYLSLE